MLKFSNWAKSKRRCLKCCSLEKLAMSRSSLQAKTKSNSLRTELMNLCQDCAAFFKPKGIFRNSKRPNKVLTVVFLMSCCSTVIWWKARCPPLKRSSPRQAAHWNPWCVGSGICQGWLQRLVPGNPHKVSKKYRRSFFTMWCGLVHGLSEGL